MTAIHFILAGLLSVAIAIVSYFYILFVEAVRFRPREIARSFEFFEEHLQPALKLETQEGLRRFALVRQIGIVLLSLDLMLAAIGAQPLVWAVAEALSLSIIAVVLSADIAPSILLTRTEGKWAMRVVPLARFLAMLVKPLLLVTGFASSVAELGGEEVSEKEKPSPADDIEALLDAGEEEGLIGQEDRRLIQSVVEFGDKTVREVMTPRPAMIALDVESPLEQMRQLMIEEEYSRIPVYAGSIDNVRGFVHGRDTMEISEERRQTMTAGELMRPISLIPESKPIHQLLREMQASNTHMAIVIDEYGQTAGLVTLEDLMEEIVGEIRDESEPESDVVEQPDHSYVASGNLDLDRLADLVGFRPDEEFESTTVGGLVCEQLGSVPSPGRKVRLDGIEIEILEADERRVATVRFSRLPPNSEHAGTPQNGSAAESSQGAA